MQEQSSNQQQSTVNEDKRTIAIISIVNNQ